MLGQQTAPGKEHRPLGEHAIEGIAKQGHRAIEIIECPGLRVDALIYKRNSLYNPAQTRIGRERHQKRPGMGKFLDRALKIADRLEQKRVLIEIRSSVWTHHRLAEIGTALQSIGQRLRRRLGKLGRRAIDDNDNLIDALGKSLIQRDKILPPL